MKRTLLVHGFDGYAAKDCRELSALRTAVGGRAVVVGYYAGDTNYDEVLPGEGATTDTSIDAIAERLAAFIERPVDLIGHSMGGLVVLATARLRADLVRRIVLLGTPLQGLPSAAGTPVAQCVEMSPGSDWLARLAATTWRADLVIGSEADEAVPIDSALAAPRAGRIVRIPANLGVHHGDLVTDPQVLRELSSRRRRRALFR